MAALRGRRYIAVGFGEIHFEYTACIASTSPGQSGRIVKRLVRIGNAACRRDDAVSVSMTSLLWDQHACLPLQTDTDVDPLTRYQR